MPGWGLVVDRWSATVNQYHATKGSASSLKTTLRAHAPINTPVVAHTYLNGQFLYRIGGTVTYGLAVKCNSLVVVVVLLGRCVHVSVVWCKSFAGAYDLSVGHPLAIGT